MTAGEEFRARLCGLLYCVVLISQHSKFRDNMDVHLSELLFSSHGECRLIRVWLLGNIKRQCRQVDQLRLVGSKVGHAVGEHLLPSISESSRWFSGDLTSLWGSTHQDQRGSNCYIDPIGWVGNVRFLRRYCDILCSTPHPCHYSALRSTPANLVALDGNVSAE